MKVQLSLLPKRLGVDINAKSCGISFSNSVNSDDDINLGRNLALLNPHVLQLKMVSAFGLRVSYSHD